MASNGNEEKVPTVVSKAPTKESAEASYLLYKQATCPICKEEFKFRAVKSSSARRIGSDKDLRPIFQGIDTIKYTLSSCPKCGYTSMSRYFSDINSLQVNYVKENALPKLAVENSPTPLTYTYNDSIELYKKALICTSAKKGKSSELAHTFLQTSWLLRGMGNEFIEKGLSENDPKILKIRQQEDAYYVKSFDAFMKSLQEEDYPIAGMDESTFNYLLSQMAFRLKRFDIASKFVSGIVVNRETPANIRDKARDLKDEIVAEMAKLKNA